MNKKGSMGIVMLSALIIVLTVSMVYIVGTPIITALHSEFNGTFNNTATQDRFSQILIIWNAWPFIIIFGAVLWVFITAMKKEPDTGVF